MITLAHTLIVMLVGMASCSPGDGTDVDLTNLEAKNFEIFQSTNLIAGKYIPSEKIRSLSMGQTVVWKRLGDQELVEFNTQYLKAGKVLYALKVKTGNKYDIFHVLSSKAVIYVGVLDYLFALNRRLRDNWINQLQPLDISDNYDKLYYAHSERVISHTGDSICEGTADKSPASGAEGSLTETVVRYETMESNSHFFKQVNDSDRVIWAMGKSPSAPKTCNKVHVHTISRTTRPRPVEAQAPEAKTDPQSTSQADVVSTEEFKLLMVELSDGGRAYFKQDQNKWTSIEKEEYIRLCDTYHVGSFNPTTLKHETKEPSTDAKKKAESTSNSEGKTKPEDKSGHTTEGEHDESDHITLDLSERNAHLLYRTSAMFKSKFIEIFNPNRVKVAKLVYNGELLYKGELSNFHVSMIKTKRNDHFIELRYVTGGAVKPTKYYKWTNHQNTDSETDEDKEPESTDKSTTSETSEAEKEPQEQPNDQNTKESAVKTTEHSARKWTEIEQAEFFRAIEAELTKYTKGTHLEHFGLYGVKDGHKIDSSMPFADLAKLAAFRNTAHPMFKGRESHRLLDHSSVHPILGCIEDILLANDIAESSCMGSNDKYARTGRVIFIIRLDEEESSFLVNSAIAATTWLILIHFLF